MTCDYSQLEDMSLKRTRLKQPRDLQPQPRDLQPQPPDLFPQLSSKQLPLVSTREQRLQSSGGCRRRRRITLREVREKRRKVEKENEKEMKIGETNWDIRGERELEER